MTKPSFAPVGRDTLRDFTTDGRLLILCAMAVATGCFGAAAAWALLKMIALFTNIAFFHVISTTPRQLGEAVLGPVAIAVPIIGGLIVGLIARFGSEKIRGHGIPEAIEAILIGQSRIAPKVALLKPLSSAIAIGTGGPFGAEGPIIMTGGALGSLFAQFFELSSPERKTLLVAGAAAGMTAVFGTPIAAILLAVELLLFEWKPRSFIPVAISAIVAATLRPYLVGTGPLFPYSGVTELPWMGFVLCAVVGIVAGLQSTVTTLCLYWIEDLFRKLPIHWMWWPALGGIAIGIGGWINPAVLGVGYENIHALLDGAVDLKSAAALLVGKAVVWAIALSSGTSGGVLAPLLIMGGALGAIESHILPLGDAGFWALLGMAAVLGGTMRAPLTATLFAVELTGNFHVMPAVLTASTAAFAVTVLIMRRSILTERIARRGLHLSREYSVNPFDVMRVTDIMAKPVDSLAATITVAETIAFFQAEAEHERHKSYPVIDSRNHVVGMVSRSDILRWTRSGRQDDSAALGESCETDVVIGYDDEMAGTVADRMAATGAGRVPIVDRASHALVGLVARRDLLRVRAHALKQERERGRRLWVVERNEAPADR